MARKTKTLDDLLLATGESYDAFADRAGVARFTLYRLRTGRNAKPRRKTLHDLATALDVDVETVQKAAQASYDEAQKDQ